MRPAESRPHPFHRGDGSGNVTRRHRALCGATPASGGVKPPLYASIIQPSEFMTRASGVTLALLLAAAAATGCDMATSGNAGSPYGVGVISTQRSGGSFTMSPAIAFYRVTGATLINSVVTRDTCLEAPYVPSADPVTSFAPAVSAGAFITFAVSGHLDTLRHSNLVDPFYRAAVAISFTPGDSITIGIPGDQNGFPASTFRAGTADTFAISPITHVATGDPVQLSWTTTPVTGSAMLLSFRYASSDSVPALDRQLTCSLVDDGAVTIDAGTIFNWANAHRREVQATRVRSLIAQIQVPRSYFNVASTFDVMVPTP